MKVNRVTFRRSINDIESSEITVPGPGMLLEIGAELEDGGVLPPGHHLVSAMLPKTRVAYRSTEIDAQLVGGSSASVSIDPRYGEMAVGSEKLLHLDVHLGGWTGRLEIPVRKVAAFAQKPSLRVYCTDGFLMITKREDGALRKFDDFHWAFWARRSYRGTVAELEDALRGEVSAEAVVRQRLTERRAALMAELAAIEADLAG